MQCVHKIQELMDHIVKSRRFVSDEMQHSFCSSTYTIGVCVVLSRDVNESACPYKPLPPPNYDVPA